MELWLLGGGAIVLIAITLWIVWPAETVESLGEPLHDEEEMLMTPQSDEPMTPQGDEFEDQYTSATADLSAGGVATAIDAMQEEAASAGPAEEPAASAEPTPYAAAGEPWSSPTIAREGAIDAAVTPAPTSAASAPAPTGAASMPVPTGAASGTGAWSEPRDAWSDSPPGRALARPRTIGMGAAVVLAIISAALGAWLYARWQRRRNAPINRVRRGLRDAQRELRSGLHEGQKGLRSGLHETQRGLWSGLHDARKEVRSSRFAGAVRG